MVSRLFRKFNLWEYTLNLTVNSTSFFNKPTVWIYLILICCLFSLRKFYDLIWLANEENHFAHLSEKSMLHCSHFGSCWSLLGLFTNYVIIFWRVLDHIHSQSFYHHYLAYHICPHTWWRNKWMTSNPKFKMKLFLWEGVWLQFILPPIA